MFLFTSSFLFLFSSVLFLFNKARGANDPRFGCDIIDPECRERLSRDGGFTADRPRGGNRCNYQDLWLIPGRADASCTRPNAKRLVEIDPRQVKIRPALIRFPGCFTIEIKNLQILQNQEHPASENSFFAKSEYQWLNVKQLGELKCQNSSSNGCGGFGNNCLRDIETGNPDGTNPASPSMSSFASQLRGLQCPQRPGYYTFRKEFCFNDWAAFDADGDCQLDFLQNEKSDLKSALASLQQIGYGTIVAKIKLAFNATGSIVRKRLLKESQIERIVAAELEERHQSWDINKGQFEKFQRWYINYRKNVWHREEYLPWLLYENEISCLRLTFDVCERTPHKKSYGGYTCD